MLKQLLQGKVFGHPLHPILVHLPIGLFVVSFLFDIGSMIRSTAISARFVQPAFYTMALGVLTALVAAGPGFIDYLDIRRDHPARKIATYHMILNLAAVVLYVVNLAIRRPQLHERQDMVLPFVLSLIGVILLSISGYLGGVMVYDDGIAVGRHRRVGKTPMDTIKRSGAEGEFVAVADERELEDGQTLRVDVNGVVMTVVKVNGQVFAFQEFCTHRFGPLSEGSFVDGTQVRCPWHRSCFDMRTGKVTHGPAKEDIRAFEVAVRDGKVQVRGFAASTNTA
jgi:nitrite reductase/ring-hydroxylating ferredoxin subunit/uncharacterized membrane protein